MAPILLALAACTSPDKATDAMQAPVDTADETGAAESMTLFAAGPFVRVDGGPLAVCALRADGTTTCWGKPEGLCEQPAIGAAALDWAVAVDVCILDAAGTPECAHIAGQEADFLGDLHGPLENIDVAWTACGLDAAGAVTCGQEVCGPALPTGSFADVMVQAGYACVLAADGSVTCFGQYPGSGCIGRDAEEDCTCEPSMPPLTYPGPFMQIAGSPPFGLRTDGTIDPWMAGEFWTEEAPEGTFRAIADAPTGACAVRADDGGISCWGGLAGSQPPDGGYTQVAVTGNTVCGLTTDGDVICQTQVVPVEDCL